MELTFEVIRGLKPYQQTRFNVHDTKDDVFRLGQIEGRNQALYLLLAIGDENVAHDHWHPDRAQLLYETRVDICRRLKLNAPHYPALGGEWPKKYPDFEQYTFRSG